MTTTNIRFAFRPILVSSLLTLSLCACSLPNATATKTAAKASGDLTDGEILQVLRTLNEGEIAQAQLAVEQSDNQQLQNAAERIIKDHQRNNQRIESMTQAGLQLEDSPLSRGLKLQTQQIKEQLSDLTGSEFDCAYLEKQIEQHQLALDTVRSELLPDAEDSQIQELLSATAPALEHHLEAAQETRQTMSECANS